MKYKIVADSSANLDRLDGVDFASVPLTIQAGAKSYGVYLIPVDELMHFYDGFVYCIYQ